MIELGLRARFLLSGAALVLTTVASGAWSALGFARLSHVVGTTLRDTEETTAATAAVANALEREDDALLFALGGGSRGVLGLAAERAAVVDAEARLDALLADPSEREAAAALRREIDAYHTAGDALLAAAVAPAVVDDGRLPRTEGALPPPNPPDGYHQAVNPLLRRAVSAAGRIRDNHFRSTQEAAAWARDEARRSTFFVAGISLGALILSVIVSFRLARRIVWPLRELTAGADAIRRGDFDHRVAAAEGDELGRLADGFNRMAEHLAELRRANVGEVIRAKETLEATLAALPDAVVIVDPEGMVSAANDVADRWLSVAPAAPRRIDDLPLPPDAVGALRAALRGHAPEDPSLRLDRAVVVSLGGKDRSLLPRVVPVPGFSEKRHGAVLLLYDVTDLVRLDEMRMELVAVASHELRTPLTTMRLTLSMLQEGAGGLAPREREIVETALLGVEQLSTIVDEFLDLTRIEAGQLRLAWDRVDVRALVAQAARAAAPRFEEAGVAFTTTFAEGAPPVISGDAARLQVVLGNALTNALKYTPRGGSVGIAASSGPAGLTLAVTDTGNGVPPEYRERIFEKFFRVEHHTGQDGGARGAGIGLYVSRQIVEAHGGSITAGPGRDGRGTTITIALPAERAAGA
jgi:NtrC-family two-component system sensor histidine kinase KinB